MTDDVYLLYALYDGREPTRYLYVGVTQNTLEARLSAHRSAKTVAVEREHLAIEGLATFNGTKSDALRQERQWQRKMLAEGHPLINVNGGNVPRKPRTPTQPKFTRYNYEAACKRATARRKR